MWDAKTSKNNTCLLLENKKQNIFTSKNNLESTRRKGFGIHQRNNKQKSEFLLILIILKKNVYRLEGLFKSSIKLEKQKNIF